MNRSPFRLGLFLVAMLVCALPAPARAFCGFYVSGADTKLFNNATMVVMMRDGNRTVLSMQNNYQGPPEDFAMVVPVPVILQKENVKTLPRDIFDRVDRMAAPRLVEYWEQDPCYREPDYRFKAEMADMAVPAPAAAAPMNGMVKIEAQFTVGEYEIVILSAKDALALDKWLHQNHYKIPQGAGPVLKPYVDSGMYFFVARVDVEKVRFEGEQAMLSPLRFHYDTESFNLPVRLGLLNSGGTQDLIVHILSPDTRFEVANYKNVNIPTNLRVRPAAKERFGEFYAALFDKTLADNPGAVITEYAWDAASCDPCPGPTLDQSDFKTLGADVLASERYSFVLTRLHARYTKDTLGEDLVFKAATPLTGGTGTPDQKGVMPQETSSYANMFQGRYAILHRWDKPISCRDPIRGRWGGPPADAAVTAEVKPAVNLAFVPRGGIELSSVVEAGLPGLVAALPEPVTVATGEITPAPAAPARRAWYRDPNAVIVGLIGLGLVGLILWAILDAQRERK